MNMERATLIAVLLLLVVTSSLIVQGQTTTGKLSFTAYQCSRINHEAHRSSVSVEIPSCLKVESKSSLAQRLASKLF